MRPSNTVRVNPSFKTTVSCAILGPSRYRSLSYPPTFHRRVFLVAAHFLRMGRFVGFSGHDRMWHRYRDYIMVYQQSESIQFLVYCLGGWNYDGHRYWYPDSVCFAAPKGHVVRVRDQSSGCTGYSGRGVGDSRSVRLGRKN